MRFTLSVAASALLAVAQLAGASPVAEANSGSALNPRVVDGHLHLLQARSGLDVPDHKSGKTRRHHGKRADGMVKKRAGSGVCKPKTTSASSSSAAASATPVQASSSSSSKAAAATSSASSNDDDTSPISSGGSSTSLSNISAFKGTNSGIGSWFRTNAGTDSTNGQSWCQTYYQDSWMGFAPSVGTMLSNFGGNYQAAAKAYCGLEVKFTNPNNGKTAIGFIADGFDDKWVLSPGSTDLTIGLFTALHGSFDNNKMTVIKGLSWEFTGNVVQQGTFQTGK